MALADWGKKLGNIAQNTVEKSKELAEITKANLAISNAEEAIRNSQMRIGQYVMENNLLRENEVLAEIYAEVDQSRETIVVQQAKIEEIKTQSVCKSCGAEMGKAVKFCAACGAERQSLTDAAEIPAVVHIRCTGCGAELASGAAFCVACGGKVEA